LILMTIEPGIHREFERDPIGRMFEIVDMPSDEVSDSFDQQKFNRRQSTLSFSPKMIVTCLLIFRFLILDE
jgi:hypothetical protein